MPEKPQKSVGENDKLALQADSALFKQSKAKQSKAKQSNNVRFWCYLVLQAEVLSMKDFREVLKKKQREVERLRKTATRLAEAERELSVLEEVFRMLGGGEDGQLQPENGLTTQSKRRRRNGHNNGFSVTYEAERILRERGQPMHVHELASEFLSRFNRQTEPNTIAGCLGRLVRKGEVFIRTEANTFGLIEWNKHSEGSRGHITPTSAE